MSRKLETTQCPPKGMNVFVVCFLGGGNFVRFFNLSLNSSLSETNIKKFEINSDWSTSESQVKPDAAHI